MGAPKWPPFLPTFGAPRRGCGAPRLLLGGGRLTARQAREELPEIARHVVVRLLERAVRCRRHGGFGEVHDPREHARLAQPPHELTLEKCGHGRGQSAVAVVLDGRIGYGKRLDRHHLVVLYVEPMRQADEAGVLVFHRGFEAAGANGIVGARLLRAIATGEGERDSGDERSEPCHCHRICTFTFGNSGDLPSRSTIRMVPSEDSIRKFPLEKLVILPQDFGSSTSYFGIVVCASAVAEARRPSQACAASAVRAAAITVKTSFVQRSTCMTSPPGCAG